MSTVFDGISGDGDSLNGRSASSSNPHCGSRGRVPQPGRTSVTLKVAYAAEDLQISSLTFLVVIDTVQFAILQLSPRCIRRSDSPGIGFAEIVNHAAQAYVPSWTYSAIFTAGLPDLFLIGLPKVTRSCGIVC